MQPLLGQPLATMFPHLISVDFEALPFDHFAGRCISPEAGQVWLDWLETTTSWELTKTGFYEQYEFSLLHVALAPTVQRLVCPETLETLRFWMSRHFGTTLSERVDVTAHKLIPNQTIRVHNDFIPGGESHRLLVQLNRSWTPSHDGYLMLFSGPEPEMVRKVIEPRSGSMQAFAISPRSFHAVSTVHGGERFTFVYSFYPNA